ncbi:MAG: replication-associated recombination protein A [Parachlamydiales bacterium]|nr:replication-associated recombination protein A [Parachlamydiales bacterium]
MPPPLAQQLRPKSLIEVVGQDHLVGTDGFLTKLIKKKSPLSILLWGPPGCGKTTIAKLYAEAFDARFFSMSAIFGSLQDLKKIFEETKESLFGPVVLFVDEIHRFNKAQQDAFLPHLEKTGLILIGATTENPSFALNNALLSRMRVLTLKALENDDLMTLIQRYEITNGPLPISQEGKELLCHLAGGDGRYLFNLIENIQCTDQSTDKSKLLTLDDIRELLQKRAALFDRQGESHYNIISALHKAVRGSDADAALYWLARMLKGGEDPLFIGRRVIRMASEDVGLADPQALTVALDACETYRILGSPEGELAIAQAVVYMALAPKSNAIYTAFSKAKSMADETAHLPPPLFALNAPTKLMKKEGYGKGYRYDHDEPLGFAGQNYFPESMERTEFYQPVARGFEREMQKRIEYFEKLRNED